MEMTVKQQMFLNRLRQLRTAMDSVEADLNAFVSMSERWNHAALSEIMGIPEELINDSNIDHHNYLVSSGIVERVEYMFRKWQEGGNDVLMDCDKLIKEAKDNGMWLFLHKVKSVGIKTDVLRKLDSALTWYEGSYNRMVYSVTHGTADLYGLSLILEDLESDLEDLESDDFSMTEGKGPRGRKPANKSLPRMKELDDKLKEAFLKVFEVRPGIDEPAAFEAVWNGNYSSDERFYVHGLFKYFQFKDKPYKAIMNYRELGRRMEPFMNKSVPTIANTLGKIEDLERILER